MKSLYAIPSASLRDEQSLGRVKGMVARVLLEGAGDGTNGRGRLAQRDIAAITGTSWEMVHISLQSLQEDGAIRIERHRMIINKKLLEEAVDLAGCNAN